MTIASVESETLRETEFEWEELFRQLRLFKPDCIVLIARKMPRLFEALKFQREAKTLLISDLAIPFCQSRLRHARVAIVDDVVNVGTTLQNATRIIRSCSPTALEVFALRSRDGNHERFDFPLNLASESPLTGDEYIRHVNKVPALVASIAKPYDLAFPLFECNYALPYTSAKFLLAALKMHLGEDQIFEIPSPQYNSPLIRATIHTFDSTSVGTLRKLRLYFDDKRRKCIITPVSIPSPLDPSLAEGFSPSVRRFHTAIVSLLLTPNDRMSAASIQDARSSALLFCYSLEWILKTRIVHKLSNFFIFPEPLRFSEDDAALLFGPSVRALLPEFHLQQLFPDCDYKQIVDQEDSPFINGFDHATLIAKTLALLRETSPKASTRGVDLHATVSALLTALSEMVKAEDPENYELTWPYTAQELKCNPYLRLRIGPTFADLLTLVHKVVYMRSGCMLDRNTFTKDISILLDTCIDQGSIVPTFSTYNNMSYRIFRRGETPPREDSCRRVLYALANYGRPLSLTRISKIFATLSYHQRFAQLVEPDVASRGYIATLPSTVLEPEPPEISHFLRDTGRLKKISDRDTIDHE